MNKFFSPKFNLPQTEISIEDFAREKSINPSRNVDINNLLNRVKINKQKELKKKIIFICGSLSTLALFAFFIVFLK